MVKTINIENEPLIYFLFYMGVIVYIGETEKEPGKRIYQHTDKKFNDVKCISSKKLGFHKNKYFRKYYELRLINRFKPKYNKETTKAPSLNLFFLKMFLWFENPNPQWIVPLSVYSPFMISKYKKFLEHIYNPKKSRWVINDYTKVWNNIDINKNLYIDNQNPFKFLINEKMKPSMAGKLRKKFTPRKEKLHNG
tara:strand:+ start:168 stop:749 length:582 start_codon:yes stop_codon:yes gene_type:complete